MAQGTILRGTIAPNRLQPLAESPAVLWIEPAPRMKLNDEIATEIVAGDDADARTLATCNQLGYNGAGVTVAVADSGLDSGDTNCDAPGHRRPGRGACSITARWQLEDAADEHSHGTHCAGIIAGNGATGEVDENGFLYGLGVAPGASIIAQRIFDGAGGYAAPPSFETLTRDAETRRADIGSNSWGDDTQGRYDLSAMEFDALGARRRRPHAGRPALHPGILRRQRRPRRRRPSAVRRSPRTSSPPARRQNDRLESAVEEFPSTPTARMPWRISPAAARARMAASSPTSSRPAPGSPRCARSMPTTTTPGGRFPPTTCIRAARARPARTSPARRRCSCSTTAATHTNATPSPALVKAALINSATDMDDGSRTEPVPNNDEGWGRVDLPALIGSTRNYDFVDQTVLLTNGSVFEQRVLIGSADEPLKITLTYTDVPGLPAAVLALVNDLDLEVIAPDGHGLSRQPVRRRANPFPMPPRPDTINNVEAVHLVCARARRIHHPRPRNAGWSRMPAATRPPVDQDFALVVSGSFGAPGMGIVTFDRPSIVRRTRSSSRSWITIWRASRSANGLAAQRGRTRRREPSPCMANGDHRPVHRRGGHRHRPGGRRRQTARSPTATSSRRFTRMPLPPGNRVFTALGGSAATGHLECAGHKPVWADRGFVEHGRGRRSVVYYGTTTPNLGLTNAILDVTHEFALSESGANAVHEVYVRCARTRRAIARPTTTAGAFFTVTNPQPPAILLLDSYTDIGGLHCRTTALGLHRRSGPVGRGLRACSTPDGGRTDPRTNLQSYRCVIWRMDEISAPAAIVGAKSHQLRHQRRLAAYRINGCRSRVSPKPGCRQFQHRRPSRSSLTPKINR